MSGQVDGFCTFCKREVVVGNHDLKCPSCGRYVDPLSLPSVPKGVQAVTVATADTVQTVTLPDIRAARAWGTSTDTLIDALEREEADALAAFEAAKTRAQNAKRAASAMRKIRSLVHVGGAVPAPAVQIAVMPKRAALTSPETPLTTGSSAGRWSRTHDACIDCGRSEVRHAARGRCLTCYRRAAESLQEVRP